MALNICLTHILLYPCGGGYNHINDVYFLFLMRGGYTYGVTYGPMIIGFFVLNFGP